MDDKEPFYEFSWDTSEYFHFDAAAGQLHACVITYDQWEPTIVERKRRILVPLTEAIPKPVGITKGWDLQHMESRKLHRLFDANPNPVVKLFLDRVSNSRELMDAYDFDAWFRDYGYQTHESAFTRKHHLSTHLDRVLAKAWFPASYNQLEFR